MRSVILNERSAFQPDATQKTFNMRFTPVFALLIVSAISGCATLDESFVRCQSDGCAADAKVTTDVETNLQQRAELKVPSPLHVQTINHVVYLNGAVAVGADRADAELVALQTPGVTQVVNNIAVSK